MHRVHFVDIQFLGKKEFVRSFSAIATLIHRKSFNVISDFLSFFVRSTSNAWMASSLIGSRNTGVSFSAFS